MKNFVGKDNLNRYKTDNIDEGYEEFNKAKIFNEFYGYQLYNLACKVPKVYIGRNGPKITHLYSKKLEHTVDFLSYLGLKPQDISHKNINVTFIQENVKSKLKGLPNLGVLLFLGVLFADRDVFGHGFSNVLFDQQTEDIVKIDPAEVDLTNDEEFDSVIEYLKKGRLKNEVLYAFYPLIGHVLDILTTQQLQKAYDVLFSIDEDVLDHCLLWTSKQLGDLPENDLGKHLLYRKSILTDLLQQRLPHYQPQKILLNSPKQMTVFRDNQEFTKTQIKMEHGQSQPYLFNKTDNYKFKYRDQLDQIIKKSYILLEKKCSVMSQESEKYKILAEAKDEYKKLHNHLLQHDGIKIKDINQGLLQYLKITNDKLIKTLEEKSPEKNFFIVAKRFISDTLKRFYTKIGLGNFPLSSQGVASQIADLYKKDILLSSQVDCLPEDNTVRFTKK